MLEGGSLLLKRCHGRCLLEKKPLSVYNLVLGLKRGSLKWEKIESGVYVAPFSKVIEVQVFCACGHCQGTAAWVRHPKLQLEVSVCSILLG